ncbi:MAG TPA: dynamin family protein [Steroidobacteraceae bacterium]|nr:dynamin family protein [Steroidobacteraceae bacterium]
MTPDHSPAALRQYERAKFELAEILREISRQHVATHGSARPPFGEDEIAELLTRLAEDRFILLVAGRFSRGKTSLMNAILGLDRLPTGILPLTSVITSVAYGRPERVQLEKARGALPIDIPMEALAEHITERGNPGNMRRIRIAHVALPAEILRRGFHFVDSPGLGSGIRENSRTTESYFPEADAVIVVSGFDGPLTDDEMRALRTFAETGRPIFLVLNKQDLVQPGERAAVLSFAEERLRRFIPAGRLRIFSTSARDGLAASLTDDGTALAESGVGALRTELIRFLLEDKQRVFIAGFCDRIASLIGSEDSTEVHTLQARLARLREEWRGSADDPLQAPSAFIRDARMEECIFCARVHNALYEFLRKYQHELATNPEARETLAAARGLCEPHLRFYASMAADRDICLALTPLMNRVAGALAAAAAEGAGYGPSSGVTEHPLFIPSCELCSLQRDVELRVADRLLTEGPDVAALPTVCLPHLRWLTSHALNTPSAAGVPAALRDLLGALLRREGAAAERLAEDMQRYVLKLDGIRRALLTDEEERASRRALAFLTGARELYVRS